jgi:hypothetical protein
MAFFNRLLERSSFGSPQAREVRNQTPPDASMRARKALAYRASARNMTKRGYEPTYSQEDFEAAWDNFIAEHGYDPITGSDDRGWSRCCYYGKRFQYWAPWKTTEPWDARWDAAADEHCNRSLIFVLPNLLGTLVIFPQVQMRTWYDGPCGDCMDLMSEECDLCPLCMSFHKPLCLAINP